mmetsp:Transcript_12168/g.27623  ORF Transcript_12168/g.27623 Transcript_12168/m.27623 type:complete len:209 (-) Transcript_12168:74-700(-)
MTSNDGADTLSAEKQDDARALADLWPMQEGLLVALDVRLVVVHTVLLCNMLQSIDKESYVLLARPFTPSDDVEEDPAVEHGLDALVAVADGQGVPDRARLIEVHRNVVAVDVVAHDFHAEGATPDEVGRDVVLVVGQWKIVSPFSAFRHKRASAWPFVGFEALKADLHQRQDALSLFQGNLRLSLDLRRAEAQDHSRQGGAADYHQGT